MKFDVGADSTCASSYELHSTHTPLRGDLIPTSALIAQAQKLGYANRFEAIPVQQPWRPVLADGTGLRLNPRIGQEVPVQLRRETSTALSRGLLPAQHPARSLLQNQQPAPATNALRL